MNKKRIAFSSTMDADLWDKLHDRRRLLGCQISKMLDLAVESYLETLESSSDKERRVDHA